MKISLIAVVLFMALSACQMNAQTQTLSSENLSDSSRALQFQIGSNFDLFSFQGTVFSYLQHINKEAALRLGLSVSVGGSNSDNSMDDFSITGDSLYQRSLENLDRKSSSFQLNAQLIRYFNPGGKLLLYGGAGPFLRYEYTKEKRETAEKLPYAIPSGSIRNSTNELKSSFWTPGIMGVLGVEWFAAKGISFMAEYGLQAAYTWGKGENTSKSDLNVRKTNTQQSGWGLTGNNVKLGLSLYFQ